MLKNAVLFPVSRTLFKTAFFKSAPLRALSAALAAAALSLSASAYAQTGVHGLLKSDS